MAKAEPFEGEAPETDLASSIDLRRALRRLGHDERLVLVRRYYLDMPFEEIATTQPSFGAAIDAAEIDVSLAAG